MVDEFDREAVVNDASVLARPRKRGNDEGEVAAAKPKGEDVGLEEDNLLVVSSDWAEADLSMAGTVSSCALASVVLWSSSEGGATVP